MEFILTGDILGLILLLLASIGMGDCCTPSSNKDSTFSFVSSGIKRPLRFESLGNPPRGRLGYKSSKPPKLIADSKASTSEDVY